MPAAAPTTPRRHPSPNAGGRASSPTPAGSQAKRSQSTERRPVTPSRPSSGGSRPSTPSRISAPASPSSATSSPSSFSSSSTPVGDAVPETQIALRRLPGGRAPDGLWPSMRSLSSSFQLESKGKRVSSSSSADQAKTRDAAPADRKRSPLRGRATPEQSENPHAKVIDHHRWPAMMGGRVSASTMSKSMDLTDKISRSALPSVPSRGVSPKRTTVSSAANTLSRSIDLADKIDRLVSSSMSSQGESPRKSPCNGADDVSKKVGVRKDLKLSSLAISRRVSPVTTDDKIDRLVSSSMSSQGGSPRKSPCNGADDVSKKVGVRKDLKLSSLAISRRVSPITTAASDGTRTLSGSMDLTEKDNSTLSPVSSPSISPSASLSSVSNAASQTTTKSSERLIGPVSNLSSSRGLSPRRTTSGGIVDLMKSIDFPEKDRRPASSRGFSPRRRLVSDGVNDIGKNMDFAEKDSRVVSSSIPSRGVSPRRRLASDGVDTMCRSSEFSGKDNRPSTSSSTSRGMSPRRRLASDGISAVTKGMDFGDNANRPSTSKGVSRGISPRLQLASDGVGNVSKGTDLADGLDRPSTSYATPRGMSPRRRVASDASNATSERIKFTKEDSGTVSSSVAPRGVSTLRQLASDGVESVSKSMDLVEKDTRPTTSSASSRGLSPRRRLSSDGVNVISKSMDLVENNNKLVTMSAAARGVSPRRRLASDGVKVTSKSIDLVENSNKPLTVSAATRGASPRRRLTSDGLAFISKSTNITEKSIRPSTPSMSSRGMSPRRRLASDGINAVLDTEFADKNCRPSSSSAALRGVSPRSRSASNAISTGMTNAENDSRPSTTSSPSCQTLQSSRLESNGVNILSKDMEISSTVSGCTSDSRLDGAGALVKSIDVTEKLTVSTEDGGGEDDPGRIDSSDVVTSAVSSSLASQEVSSRHVTDDVKNASESVGATQKGNRPLSVKVPSRVASPRRRLASDGIDTISKSMDFAEKDKKPMTVSVPSRGMSPRRTARSDSADIMSKSMDFPLQVFSTRRVLGPDGANAMSRSMDLTDKIRQKISSTMQSSRVSPRKMPLAYNRIKGPEILSGDAESPGSADGNESQEENASSSPDAPSNSSEKSTPPKQLARRSPSPSHILICPSSSSNASSTSSFVSRRLPSPSRTRPSTPVSPCSSARSDSASSILSYIGDATRGKKSPTHTEDAHQLRLLHNRNLQWCFTTSYVDELLSIQKISAEMDYLDHWAALQTEHSSSLSSATEALKASTLRLPVSGGAKADVLTVKNAVSSAVDIMQAMGSSVCHLLSKLQASHSLVTELSAVAAKESTLLNEYRELLATAAALQVQSGYLFAICVVFISFVLVSKA
ncbi:AUGMIN subunit 8 [Zea mays]|uniref:AUGMIN subunit 8 n=1 Tax=Zea mays TaxID=4577 RepID=A0A3L6EMI8_MAIZE|nr:hypothetical protein Zm00014a_008316 [Zea mays]PWZ21272.1 AUGMIN subunit 8 [Zea mays]